LTKKVLYTIIAVLIIWVIDMKKVLLIINPHSGKSKNKSMLYDIIDIISGEGCLVTTQITHKIGDASKFAGEAGLSGEYDIIICSGGDGTLNETISGVASSGGKVPIGYIPTGSTNDFAKSLGIPSDAREASLRAVNGKEQYIDIGLINGAHFNYVASFGAFTSVSYSAPQSLKNMLGHMAYVLTGIKDMARIKATHLKIECNGEVFEDDYIFGAVTNTTSLGGIVKIDDALVEFNDGLFELCLVRKPKNPVDITKIAKGVLSSDYSSDYFVFRKGNKMHFELDEKLTWSLDGEKYDGDKVLDVEVIESAVKLKL